MTGFALVSTTVAGAEAARRMARELVGAKLAGCVQIAPITSVYRWDGTVQESEEILLVCKIAAADFSDVERAIRAIHDYDVPEIVMTPIIDGHRPYLDWLSMAISR